MEASINIVYCRLEDVGEYLACVVPDDLTPNQPLRPGEVHPRFAAAKYRLSRTAAPANGTSVKGTSIGEDTATLGMLRGGTTNVVSGGAERSEASEQSGVPLTAKQCKVFIVCDRNVGWVVDRIGVKAARVMDIEATEQDKSLETVLEIDRWLMEQGADRSAFVLGIGGGITTDMVGFAASVYKRGVKFAFIPTTLLSQVDAAIGGKNGVNLDSYKNMVGVIRQPEATFICPEVLGTLPYPQIVSGAAELLKTFIIQNERGNYEEAVSVLSAIRTAQGDFPGKENGAVPGGRIRGYSEELRGLVAAAADVKAGIAGRDPFENGERRLLNLGHTFAHAIEKLSDEAIGHGEAVSMGIILAARLSERLGLAQEGLAARLKTDFEACGMPVECPYSIKDMAGAMKKDKKAEGAIVHFVLPLAIGRVETRDLSPEDAAGLLG